MILKDTKASRVKSNKRMLVMAVTAVLLVALVVGGVLGTVYLMQKQSKEVITEVGQVYVPDP